MKKLYNTNISKKYVLILYRLIKCYEKEIVYNSYQNTMVYETSNVIHEGCYKKEFIYEFNSDKKLKEYLKPYYINYNNITLYGSIKNAMKDRYYENFIVILKEFNSNEENIKIILKPKKKKKSNKRIYYCDCFKCVGTTYKMREKIIKSDDRRIEKNDVFSD